MSSDPQPAARAIVAYALALFAILPHGAWAAAPAAPNPAELLATLDAAQRRAVQQVFRKNTSGGEGAQADALAHGDLDGDGKPEMVMLWTLLGPTYHRASVSVFTSAANGWREVGTADVLGQAQKLSLQGTLIRVDTLTAGPSDARCCPTRKSVQRLRLQAGKLVEMSAAAKR